jgi:hypothetical protein
MTNEAKIPTTSNQTVPDPNVVAAWNFVTAIPPGPTKYLLDACFMGSLSGLSTHAQRQGSDTELKLDFDAYAHFLYDTVERLFELKRSGSIDVDPPLEAVLDRARMTDAIDQAQSLAALVDVMALTDTDQRHFVRLALTSWVEAIADGGQPPCADLRKAVTLLTDAFHHPRYIRYFLDDGVPSQLSEDDDGEGP